MCNSNILVHIEEKKYLEQYASNRQLRSINPVERENAIYLKDRMIQLSTEIKESVDRLEYIKNNINDLNTMKKYFDDKYPDQDHTLNLFFLIGSTLVVFLSLVGLGLHDVNTSLNLFVIISIGFRKNFITASLSPISNKSNLVVIDKFICADKGKKRFCFSGSSKTNLMTLPELFKSKTQAKRFYSTKTKKKRFSKL